MPDVAVSVEATTQVQVHTSIDRFRSQSAYWHQAGSQAVVDKVAVDGAVDVAHVHGHTPETRAQSAANSHQKGSQVVMVEYVVDDVVVKAEVDVDAVVVDTVPEVTVVSEVDVAVVAVVLDTVRDDIVVVVVVEVSMQVQLHISAE